MQSTYYNGVMDSSEHHEPASVGFGKALFYYRRRAGYTQQELAEALSVNQKTVSSWEQRTDPPRDFFIYLEEVAELLGVEPVVLEQGEIQRPAPVPKRPGGETVGDMIRRLAPNKDPMKASREVERFLRWSEAKMKRLNDIGEIMVELQRTEQNSGEPEEDEGDGEIRKVRPPREEDLDALKRALLGDNTRTA
jgi:transcriptional regulator with XRE-family HTH domain